MGLVAAGWLVDTFPTAPGGAPPPPGPRQAARPARPAGAPRPPAPHVASAGTPAGVPILMYHEIGLPPRRGWPGLYVSPADFARQMAYLAAAGFHPLTLEGWYGDLAHGRPLPPRPVIITFDDGYAGVYRNALPVLERYRFPAVLNLQVGLVGRPGALTLEEVKALARAGFEIDAHTVSHPDLTRLGAAAVAYQLDASRAWIRQRLGQPADFFAYPSGRYDARVVEAVRRAGFLGAETTVWGLADPARTGWYTLPRIRVSGGESLAAFRDALTAATAAAAGGGRVGGPGAGRAASAARGRGAHPVRVQVRRAACAPVAFLYHDVLPDGVDRGALRRDGAVVAASQFRSEMAWLARSGRPVETVRQFLAAPRPCAVLITFDDGYAGLAGQVLPVLEAYRLPATLFLLGSALGRPGYLSEEELRRLVASGLFDVESHTYAAHDAAPGRPAFWQMTPAQFQADQAKELALFRRLGLPAPVALAYPHGRPNPGLVALLAADGYRAAFTVRPGWLRAGADRWRLPRWTVWPDWPLADLRAAAGADSAAPPAGSGGGRA